MKVEQEVRFYPIVITLETEEEVRVVTDVIGSIAMNHWSLRKKAIMQLLWNELDAKLNE